MKVLNFGSLNIDMVYSVDHVVRPGETTASAELRYFCGGKGLNQSVALARAGADVCHAGCVGADGNRLISLLRDNGVDTSLVTKSESPSGHAIIQVDRDGQNSILLFGGANMEITPEQIENAVGNFSTGGRLFLQNETHIILSMLDFDAKDGREQINISLESDKPSVVTVSKIDADHANPLRVWERMGRPQVPNRSQLSEIEEESAPREEALPFEYRDGRILLNTDIGANEIRRIIIRR